MSQSQSFPVDLFDLDDVRVKLPRAREILTQKEAKDAAAARDTSQWRNFVRLMEERAELQDDAAPPEPSDSAPSVDHDATGQPVAIDFTGVESVLDAAVRTVNEQNRPIRSKEVAELLRSSGKFDGLTNETVSNALYYAAERADPRRVRKLTKRGFYAPPPPQQPTPAEIPGSVPAAVQQFVSHSIAAADSTSSGMP
jgi:hypothetical protein